MFMKTAVYTKLEYLMSDGEYHSGQELASALGVSRTAIWKRLQQLKQSGVAVQSSNALGYRVLGGLDLLDAGLIAQKSQVNCEVKRCVASTNDDIKSMILQEIEPLYLIAEQQTKGRGRQGKRWHMPFGSGLCFSTSWQLTQGIQQAQGLSLVVGVAIIEALLSMGVEGLSLKWPNDIWLDGKKLCGILIELEGDVMGQVNAVIGVGLNVRLPLASIGSDSALVEERGEMQAFDCADLSSYRLHRNDIMPSIITALEQAKALFFNRGFSAFKERWQACDALFQRQVMIKQGLKDAVLYGVAQGVDDYGGLKVFLDADMLEGSAKHMKVFYGGDISPRLV